MNASRVMACSFGVVVLALVVSSCVSKQLAGVVDSGCELLPSISLTRASFPAWDRTGERIALVSSVDDQGVRAPGLYVVDVTNGLATRIVGKDSLGWYGPWWLSWAPNDDRLLMWLDGRIQIVDVNTGAWQQITDGARDVNLPCWSPTGDSVLFTRGRNNNEPATAGGLYVRDVRTGVQFRFLSRDSVVTLSVDRYAYSPDGQWIACVVGTSSPDGIPNAAYEIEIVRSDGSERRRLTHFQGYARNPQWVSDEEVEFDYVPYECMGTGQEPVAHTMSVRIDGTLMGRWREDLVDSRVQFSWLPAIDLRRGRAAVVWLDPETGYGELFVRPLRGGPMRRVFRYDRPSTRRSATPWPFSDRRP